MKVLISDLPKSQNRDIDYECNLLKKAFPKIETVIYDYDESKKDEFKELLKDADILLTSYIYMDAEMLDCAPQLKMISLTSTGYNFVDMDSATKRHVAVAAIGEYCTDEVADHTMALLLALSRKLKSYIRILDAEKKWLYKEAGTLHSLRGQTLGIFGFGKIGRAVAIRAQSFGIHVVAYSPHVSKEEAEYYGVKLVSPTYIAEHCDILSNHMKQTPAIENFFNADYFNSLKRYPIFLNVGRGGCVDEEALYAALKEGKVCAAGLDVLKDENPNLSKNKFVGMDNVLMTPHAAFYTVESVARAQRISVENIIYYLKGEFHKIDRVVNSEIL